MLDNRLRLCAEMVTGSGTVCDVGTDHALLAAELITQGICSKVIASDIKEGPLESAKRTVERYDIADKVELILSDGLANVPLEGVSDIVIAGMGGETIADIIDSCEGLIYSDINLVLQPMTKAEELRRRLFSSGYAIESERAVEEGGRLYTVMSARWNEGWTELTEYEAAAGFFADDDEYGEKYRRAEAERFGRIVDPLEAGGKHNEAVHASAMQYKLTNGTDSVPLSEIYAYLDSLYPFATQDSWDNSGMLVESSNSEISKVLLTLDIDDRAVTEAENKSTDLIISHHPVIFRPLKKLCWGTPVYKLVEDGISAICMHTNVDKAEGGTNGVILRKLNEKLSFAAEPEIFEDTGDGLGYGWICELKEKADPREFGLLLKEVFGCEYVRMTDSGRHSIRRFAFCSGSGGSTLGLAAAKGCDAYITGDVKHDVWIDAGNLSVTLYDCGHFHTENLVLSEFRRVLEERYPQLDIEITDCSGDPCDYI